MLVHHRILKSNQKHSLPLLNGEYRFNLIRCFNQQVMRALLTLRINDLLALLLLLGLNRLFELNSIHCSLAEPSFVYHFVTSDPVFFRWITIRDMLKNLSLLLVSHLLILFYCFFGSLLEILLSIVNADEIIDSCLWF